MRRSPPVALGVLLTVFGAASAHAQRAVSVQGRVAPVPYGLSAAAMSPAWTGALGAAPGSALLSPALSAPSLVLPSAAVGPRLPAAPMPAASVGFEGDSFASGARAAASGRAASAVAADRFLERWGRLPGRAEAPGGGGAEAREKTQKDVAWIQHAFHGGDQRWRVAGERAREFSGRLFDGSAARASGAVPVQVAPRVRGSRLGETQGLSGRVLFDAVHEIAKDGQIVHDYGTARKFLFSRADNVTIDGRQGIVDAYSGIFIPGASNAGGDYREPGDANHDGYVDREGMNVEHVWPQSFFGKRKPMVSDLHHLMATLVHPNGMRSAFPFGEVLQRGAEYSNSGGARLNAERFEPPDFTKGRVARALLYFFTRYCDQNIFQAGARSMWNADLELILRWNREHPPTDFERRRNDLVEGFQGNRNPFVDDPTLADRIGAEGFASVEKDRLWHRMKQKVSQGVDPRLSRTVAPHELN